jgi:Domain of unknown function (DUF4173)
VSERTRLGLGILVAGVVLGILGDALLRQTPWGLNWALWSVAALVAAVVVTRLVGFEPPPAWPWLMGLALLFSAALVWRASPVLAGLNLLSAAACAALAAGAVRAGVVSYVVSAAGFAVGLLLGPIAPTTDVDWDEVPRGWGAHAGAAARGFVVALPLLALFGGLFVAADAVFAELVSEAFDFEDAFVRVTVIALWGWIACGLLHQLLVRREAVEVQVERRLGAVEVGVILGTLNVLFLVFVVVQLRYLFGGDGHVLGTTGLTYAEYARRGFFELVAVSTLVLPTLLLMKSFARARRLFRALATSLVVLLAVVMASAVERMRLYTDAYGLTQLRLYTLAFMLALGVVFAWMLVTLLRDRHRAFMSGAFAVGLVAVAALNVVNPDALIARINLDRHLDERKQLDSSYLAGLSADATPTVLARLDELEPDARRFLRSSLAGDSHGWRTWNWSRARAGNALDDYERRALAADR